MPARTSRSRGRPGGPRRLVRLLVASLIGAVGAVGAGGPAFADPAGPTDYRSEIRDIEPPTPHVALDVLGGDSFVQLVASPGTDVVVIGYQGEDYLWFRTDGTVLENRNAPSTYTNNDRYGGDAIPPNADREAEPDWEEVGSDGTWAWHDHRAHWMQTSRPAGKAVGDQIVEGVVPLVVDGIDVDVTVVSVWEPAPSPVPVVLGAVGGVGLVGVSIWLWRSQRRWALALVPLSVIALVAGIWQYASLPAETGPRSVWWIPPALAVVAAAVAFVAERRRRAFAVRAAGLVVGVQLAIWGVVKRDGLTAALIPTDAPGWFDRLATSSALAGGTALGAFALWTLFAHQPKDPPSGPGPERSRTSA